MTPPTPNPTILRVDFNSIDKRGLLRVTTRRLTSPLVLGVGDVVTAYEDMNTWCPARVIEIDRDRGLIYLEPDHDAGRGFA